MSTDDFRERLAAPTPTPGGGAAAARVGTYACALLRMVLGIGKQTIEKADRPEPAPSGAPAPGAPSSDAPSSAALSAGAASSGASGEATARSSPLACLLDEAKELSARFESLETEDMAAFESFLAACRLPRSTPAEKEARRAARAQASLEATEVPLRTMEAATRVLELVCRILELSRTAPIAAEGDLFGAAELASAVFRVAELNVRANDRYLAPEAALEVRARWAALAGKLDSLLASVGSELTVRLGADRTR